MGTIDLQQNKKELMFVDGKLKEVGMKIDNSVEWLITGPHEGFDFNIFVGPADFDKNIWTNTQNDGAFVAVCRRGVYEAEAEDDWMAIKDEDNRITKPKI